MKLKKIIITSTMLSAMISTIVVSNSFADTQEVNVSASKETANAGESFSVDISLSNVQPSGINACEFAIEYDSSIISIDKVEKGAVANTGAESKDSTSGDIPIFDSAKSENDVNVIWTTGADSDCWIKDSGVFCTISGKVSSSASNGDVSEIKIVPIVRDTTPDSGKPNDKVVFSYIDGDSKAYYDYKISNGSVTVGKSEATEPTIQKPTTQNPTTKIVWGDATNDGVVDLADVVATASYVGDPVKNTISEQGMLNADVHDTGGGINANDVLAIQQYLAKIVDSLPI